MVPFYRHVSKSELPVCEQMRGGLWRRYLAGQGCVLQDIIPVDGWDRELQ